jgi:hypothetical protein
MLIVRVPNDLTYCPVELWQSNTKPAEITLARTRRPRRQQFESLDGGLISKKEELARITLRYQPFKPAARDLWVEIDRRIILEGGPVHSGRYWASFETEDGNRVSWQNLIVKDDSPDELTFKLPPPLIFRGRVIDPVSGKPLAGVFVGGYSGSMQKTMAAITEAEWAAAEQLAAEPKLIEEALKPFLGVNNFRQIVRTIEGWPIRAQTAPRLSLLWSCSVCPKPAAYSRSRLPRFRGHGDSRPAAIFRRENPGPPCAVQCCRDSAGHWLLRKRAAQCGHSVLEFPESRAIDVG